MGAQDEEVDSRRPRGRRAPPRPAIGRLIKERVYQTGGTLTRDRMKLLNTDSGIKLTAT